MTPAQIEQRRQAGKGRYRQLVATILRENTRSDGSINHERAAERLSCVRLNWGFRFSRGLTSAHMREWATRLGMIEEPL